MSRPVISTLRRWKVAVIARSSGGMGCIVRARRWWYWWRLLSPFEKHCGATGALRWRHGRGVAWRFERCVFGWLDPGEGRLCSLLQAP